MTGKRQEMEFANPGEWADLAACRGKGDLMDIPRSHRAQKPSAATREIIFRARSICLACPVLDECRDWAMTSPDPAFELMAGGLTWQERNQRRDELGLDYRTRSPLRVGQDRRAQRPLPPCGTRGGYRLHLRESTVPCEPCCAANARYSREYKNEKKTAS